MTYYESDPKQEKRRITLYNKRTLLYDEMHIEISSTEWWTLSWGPDSLSPLLYGERVNSLPTLVLDLWEMDMISIIALQRLLKILCFSVHFRSVHRSPDPWDCLKANGGIKWLNGRIKGLRIGTKVTKVRIMTFEVPSKLTSVIFYLQINVIPKRT